MNIIIALSFVPYMIITLYGKNAISANISFYTIGKREFIFAILLLLIHFIFKIFITITKEKVFFNKKRILMFEYSYFIVVFIYLAAILISLKQPIFTWRYLTICLPLIIAIITIFISAIFKIINIMKSRGYIFKFMNIIVSLTVLILLSNFVSNMRTFGGGWWYNYKESQQYINMDAKSYDYAAQINTGWYSNENAKFFGLTPLPNYKLSTMEQYEVIYLPPFEIMTADLLMGELGNISLDNVLKICVNNDKLEYSKYVYKIYPHKYSYSTIAELPVTSNVYTGGIDSVDFDKDGKIILKCGNIDPQIFIPLQIPIVNDNVILFIEITYTNNQAGGLQVFFDYGQGLSEKNSSRSFISVDFIETAILLPIIGWHEGEELIGIRIDPPNNTEFKIVNIKILSQENVK